METITEKPKIYDGLFTIVNRETREHRTFRIRSQKPDADFKPGARIVGLLIGPDNTRSYQNFGELTGDGVKVWRRYAGKAHETYGRLLWLMLTEPKSPLHERYEVKESRKCMRCFRELTDPTSVDLGIGPECRKKG